MNPNHLAKVPPCLKGPRNAGKTPKKSWEQSWGKSTIEGEHFYTRNEQICKSPSAKANRGQTRKKLLLLHCLHEVAFKKKSQYPGFLNSYC